MQRQDIQLVPLDADRPTLITYLNTHPRWTALTRGAAYAWDGKDTRAHRIRIPGTGDPYNAEEDRKMCAQAAIEINALVLGLPTGTPGEAVRRLVEIANLASSHKPGTVRPAFTPAHIHAVATGQEVSR
ncbi:hypothetical protein ACWCSD_38835 [Nonomuraea sp. NPDC001684]